MEVDLVEVGKELNKEVGRNLGFPVIKGDSFTEEQQFSWTS